MKIVQITTNHDEILYAIQTKWLFVFNVYLSLYNDSEWSSGSDVLRFCASANLVTVQNRLNKAIKGRRAISSIR